MVDISPEMTKSDALKLEYRIKRLPANKKISKLIKEGNQMTIAKDLQALNKDMKALGKKMDNLLKAVEKSEKAEAPKKLAGKSVKAKTLKKAPVKKAPLREKIAPPTATDQVLKIIKGSKKGVDTATLMKKTGFGQKKVWNILQRVYKQGRIKRVGKGLYAVT